MAPILVVEPFEQGIVSATPYNAICLLCNNSSQEKVVLVNNPGAFRSHMKAIHAATHKLPDRVTNYASLVSKAKLRSWTLPISQFQVRGVDSVEAFVCDSCSKGYRTKKGINDHIKKGRCQGSEYSSRSCRVLICGQLHSVEDKGHNDKARQKMMERCCDITLLQPCRNDKEMNGFLSTQESDVRDKLLPFLAKGEDLGSWPSILYPIVADIEGGLDKLPELVRQVETEMKATEDPVLSRIFELLHYTFDDRPYPVVNLGANIKKVLQCFTTPEDGAANTSLHGVFKCRKSSAQATQVLQYAAAFALVSRDEIFMKYYEWLEWNLQLSLESLFKRGYVTTLFVDMIRDQLPGKGYLSSLEKFSIFQNFQLKNDALVLLRANYAGKWTD